MLQETKDGNVCNVCAGIVTYNPDIELFRKCLDSVIKQVERVYVFDNGSKNACELSQLLNKYTKVVIIYNDDNAGIAKALNELCKIADEDGYSWILTMDQDSICCSNMVNNLATFVNDRYGIIAPRIEFWKDDVLITSTKKVFESPERVRACITSGSLTNLEAWKKIGGFDEWMFIDHVDNEFCTHLIVEGYEVVRVHEAVLHQRAGEMKYKRIFSRNILLPNYSEKRNYYICRNTVYYLRKYRKNIDYGHEIAAFLYSQMIKFLFEKNRYKTLRSTYRGVKDAYKKLKADYT